MSETAAASTSNTGDQTASSDYDAQGSKHKYKDTTTTTVKEKPTTTVKEEPTTTVEETTTTEPTTATTTQPTTTTTSEATSTTQVPTEVTDPAPTDVDDSVLGTSITNTTPPDEVEALEVLPFTGSESDALLMLAASVIALGGILLISTRREEG
jgi:hypothetical protein